jgi:hypothetical protein
VVEYLRVFHHVGFFFASAASKRYSTVAQPIAAAAA